MRYVLLVLLLISPAFGGYTVTKGKLPVTTYSSGKSFVVGRGVLPDVNWCSPPIRKPTVRMYTATWCGWCRAAKTALTPEVLANLPFDVVPVDTDRSNEYKGPIPVFRWETPNGGVRTVTWSSWVAIKADWEKTAIPTPTPQSIIRKTSTRLTVEQLRGFARTYRGQPWDVDNGDYWSHLQNGVTHKFNAQQLNGLTQAECAKIHAGDHWGYLTPFSIGGK